MLLEMVNRHLDEVQAEWLRPNRHKRPTTVTSKLHANRTVTALRELSDQTGWLKW